MTECILFYAQTSSNKFFQKAEWWHFTSLNGKYPLFNSKIEFFLIFKSDFLFVCVCVRVCV